MQKKIGKNTLGDRGGLEVETNNYQRSSHNMRQKVKTTISPGTLVPFYTKVVLPGDDIEATIKADVMTLPTVGALFGKFKLQIDYFYAPVDLWQGKLHLNMNKIGLDMSKIKLPQIEVRGERPLPSEDINGAQINPSCVLSHLNLRGIGVPGNGDIYVKRQFNAIPYLMYCDVYKNYYANQQEGIGAVIHNPMVPTTARMDVITLEGIGGSLDLSQNAENVTVYLFNAATTITVKLEDEGYEEFDLERIRIRFGMQEALVPITELWTNFTWDAVGFKVTGTGFIGGNNGISSATTGYYEFDLSAEGSIEPRIRTFNLDNIDEMREDILTATKQVNAFVIKEGDIEPYGLLFNITTTEEGRFYSVKGNQEGLFLKTYNSDLFNNWVSTEWIDGDGGVNEITKVAVDEEGFTINDLNMKMKVYELLNDIAVSGGDYYSWKEVVYGHKGIRRVENPIYLGGMSNDIVFQEIVSTAESGSNPLATIAGKGGMGGNWKGGKISLSPDSIGYIMGIASITPKVDYSQGNQWDTDLKTMDDFHKPGLDQIGFQDLITEQMAYWDTMIDNDGIVHKRSAGKVPAWVNYMTDVDVTRGNFALQNEQMFMTLNRRYKPEWPDGATNRPTIEDLTTYIDPAGYNYIFADTRRDAQNFWLEIETDAVFRRKMSAKIMPNVT